MSKTSYLYNVECLEGKSCKVREVKRVGHWHMTSYSYTSDMFNSVWQQTLKIEKRFWLFKISNFVSKHQLMTLFAFITWQRCFQVSTLPATSSFGAPASSIRSSTSSRTTTTATPASTSSQVGASLQCQTRHSHHTCRPVNTHVKCKDSIRSTKDKSGSRRKIHWLH